MGLFEPHHRWWSSRPQGWPLAPGSRNEQHRKPTQPPSLIPDPSTSPSAPLAVESPGIWRKKMLGGRSRNPREGEVG
jgi:hypothetical protein